MLLLYLVMESNRLLVAVVMAFVIAIVRFFIIKKRHEKAFDANQQF